MAIVTKNAHAWFVTTNSSGKKQTVYNNETEKHNYPFGFEIHFSDVPQPQQNTVTLYNLSKSHSNFYRKKQKCYVAWNWNSTERKILAEGYITKIDVTQHDGTTDTKNITFTEGTDYNNLDARTLKETKNKKVKKVIKILLTGKKPGVIINSQLEIWGMLKKWEVKNDVQ